MTDLMLAEPPWLLALDDGEARTAIDRLVSSGGRVVRLDARWMRTEAQLHAAFAHAWEFPDYYGANPAALRDCLSDLSWLDAAPAWLSVIEHSEDLLIAEPEGVRRIYREVLEDTCATWAEPIDEGQWWDRGPVPFHVLLQPGASPEP